MISSSPSPTLHSTSPHHAAPTHFTRPHSSASPKSSSSSTRSRPTQQQQPSPRTAAASPLRSKPSPGVSRTTRDASTQYSPLSFPLSPTPPRAKRKERPVSVEHEPEEPTAQAKASEKKKLESRPAVTPGNLSSSSSSVKTESSSSSSKRPRAGTMPRRVMPVNYETCDVRDLVQLIAAMLMELIRFNDDIPLQDGRLTRFHSRAPPTISVVDYLQRLTTHATLSPPILLSMVYYIDRLCVLYPEFTISSLTVHRYLIASATVASKGLSDSFWTNNTYARVGGVSLKELALLELEFLWRLEWRIVPKPEILVDYYRSLVERNDGFEMEQSEEPPEQPEQGSQ